MQLYKVMEIAKPDGSPMGKYRMVVSNSSGSRIHGLCDHEHDTREGARACPGIQAEMERTFPGPSKRGQATYEAFARAGDDSGVPWDDLSDEAKEAWEKAALAAQGRRA